MLVRGCFLFGSLPLLKLLSPTRTAVTWQDATVMTWGGLRGAVGLALAIQVANGKGWNGDIGKHHIADEEAELVLFFVSGVAFLTTLINATTAPMLVKKLGITQAPEVQLKLMKKFNEQLVNLSIQEHNPPEVTEGLVDMLHKIEHHFHSPKSPRASLSATKLSKEVQTTANLLVQRPEQTSNE